MIVDAVTEQQQWNRYQVASPSGQGAATASPTPAANGSPAWVFRPGTSYVDPLVVAVKADEVATGAMQRLTADDGSPASPLQTRLGQFFMRDYAVGSEQLSQDVPSIVLLETLSTALLVLSYCVLGMLGQSAARIQRHPLYVFGFNLPLLASHALIRLLRRTPGWGLGIFLGISALSLLLLAVGFGWWNQLISTSDGLAMGSLLVFIVAPLFVLFLQMGWLARRGRAAGPTSGSAASPRSRPA